MSTINSLVITCNNRRGKYLDWIVGIFVTDTVNERIVGDKLSRVLGKRLKVKFTLEQAMNSQKGSSEVQLYSFFNLGTRLGWVVNL
jgi:hypothetical protein